MHLPNNSTYEEMEKAYFWNIYSKEKTIAGTSRVSGKKEPWIRRRFKKWGWKKKLVETNVSTAVADKAQPTRAASATPSASRAENFLTPEVRAKLQEMKQKKR